MAEAGSIHDFTSMVATCAATCAEVSPLLALLACTQDQEAWRPKPEPHLPGQRSLLNTDPVAKTPGAAQGDTKMVFLAKQSRD